MLSKAHWAALWVSLALSISGCTSEDERSSLLIAVAAGAPLAERIDRIVISTDRNEYTAYLRASAEAHEVQKLPFSLTVNGRPGLHTTVEVRAYAGEQVLVTRTARIDLDGPGHKLWRVVLSAQCEGISCETDKTCVDCSRTCGDNRVRESDLKVVGPSDDGLDGWQAPYCVANDEGDDDGPLDGDHVALDAGTDGALGDAETSVVPGLSLRVPAVVAAPGCVAVTVTRPEAGGALALGLSGTPQTAFYADDKCQEALAEPAFAANQASATFYLAPMLAAGAHTASITLGVQAGAESAEQAVEVRMRALQVSRGYFSACALLADGSLYCQGDRLNGRLGLSRPELGQVPVPTRGVPALTASEAASARLFGEEAHSCVQIGDSLRCFGFNSGSLGNGTTDDSIAWTTPQGLGQKVLQADLGVDQTCAVKDIGGGDTQLLCFGANDMGQCGPGATKMLVPTAVTALTGAGVTSRVVQCGAGWGYTCARTADGEVYCFSEVAMQTATALPYPAYKMQFSPPENPTASQQGLIRARELAVGLDVTCIIGSARGDSEGGEEGVYCRHKQEPLRHVAGLPAGPVVRLRASLQTGCAQVGNELYCFGEGAEQWLGTEGPTDYGTASRVPLPAGKLEDFALGESDQPTLSVLIEGLVYSSGYQLKGALGIDPGLGYQFSMTRTTVLDGLDVTDVSFAASRSCALVAGTVRCWGRGRIGDGSDKPFFDAPTTALGLDQVTDMTSDDNHVLALRNQELWSWGEGFYGQIGSGLAALSVPTKASRVSGSVTQVAVDAWHSCLRFGDGSMGCLGQWNGDDAIVDPLQILPPRAGDEEADIAVNENGACGIVGGKVNCVWNEIELPAFEPDEFGNDVLELDAVGKTVCARKADGTGHCLVDDANLLFGTAGGSTTVLELRAGRFHACALMSDHTLWCAGDNTRGQLGQARTITWSETPLRVPGLGTVEQFDCGADITCAHDESGWRCSGDNSNNGFATSSWLIREPTLIAPWSD